MIDSKYYQPKKKKYNSFHFIKFEKIKVFIINILNRDKHNKLNKFF